MRRPKITNCMASFSCEECCKEFSSKFSLQRHFQSIHNEKTEMFECSLCEKTCNRKDVLLKHIRRVHSQSSDSKLNLIICEICQKTFAEKYSLRRHVQHTHKKISEIFECFHCGKSFSYKHNLHKHVIEHMNKSNFECFHCGKNFVRKEYIRDHIRRSHPGNSVYVLAPKANNFRCGSCNCCFAKKHQINLHYREIHDVNFEIASLKFQSVNEFMKWKMNMERHTVTQFIAINKWSSTTYDVKIFMCHRSHTKYVCKRRRSEKFTNVNGSKKLPTYCPAQMTLKVDKVSGTCSVDFVKTHVGHPTEDRRELCYIYLNESEKMDIAEKIQMGVPRDQLRKSMILSNHGTEIGNRFSILNMQDIYNIAVRCGSDLPNPVTSKNKSTKNNTFIDTHEKNILYFKPTKEPDKRYGLLQNEDLILIFMNEMQEKKLRLYGSNIIAFDGPHSTNNDEYSLHTLLVYDVDREGIPVAFLITNRNDQTVINIFLKCILERVGHLQPRTLISDVQPSYFSSWVNVMGESPSFTLYCTWHVHEAWRKNFKKIRDSDKRNYIKSKLMAMSYELNPVVFEEHFNELVSIEDPDIEEFLKYFRQYFMDTERWAYCYRKNAGVNVNVTLETFHKCFKYEPVINGKEDEWLSTTLQSISEYLQVRESENEIKLIRGKRSSKLSNLRERHHEAKNFMNMHDEYEVIAVNDAAWLAPSFSNDELFYLIRKTPEPKECLQYGADVVCKLECQLCEFCFHDYTCECLDASIKNNMCKHIHALGRQLQKLRNNRGVDVTEVAPDELVAVSVSMNVEENKEQVETRTPACFHETDFEENNDDKSNIDVDHYDEYSDQENDVKIENRKTYMREKFEEILEHAQCEADLIEIERHCLNSIIPTLKGKYPSRT